MIIQHVKDVIAGKTTILRPRSPHWASVRAAHLKTHPKCVACDGMNTLEVHHKKPFHLFPELELEESNLITLCESKVCGINCHLKLGHLGNYKNYNKKVVPDAKAFYQSYVVKKV